MRFLFDAHHLGLNQTGNETWTRNVVTAMQDVDAEGEIEYVVTPLGIDELRRITTAPAHVVGTSSLRRLTLDLPRVARATNCDAMVVTYTAPLTRRPVVVVVHDVSAWHSGATEWLSFRERMQYRATVGISCRIAAHVLASSEFTRDDLRAKLRLVPHRVSLAMAAVDPELRALLARTATPHDTGERLRVLAVGNVVPRKNLVVLAEAVRECRRMGTPVELRIVGSVSRTGRSIASTIQDILGADACITGYVSADQLALEYKSAHVLAFPSMFEGFGIPVIEAMAAGIPVIVSNSSSLPGVAGGAALVCPPTDVAAWRDALLRVRDDRRLRDDLSQRGLRRSRDFSWEDAAKEVLDRLHAAGKTRGLGNRAAWRRGVAG